MKTPGLHKELTDKVQAVRTVLIDYFRKQEGNWLKGIETLDVRQRPYSRVVILDAKTGHGVKRLVMKTIVAHPANKSILESGNQAVVEYNLLQYLWPKFKNIPGCSVPRPVLVLPKIDTYVMDFVDGPLLVDGSIYARYFSSKKQFRLLEQYYHYCGKWLRHFQLFTGVNRAGPTALDNVMDRCVQKLQLIEDLRDKRIPYGFRQCVTRFLREQLASVGGNDVVVCGRHGDFGPWNVITNDDAVTVIDFLGYKQDPLPVDILKMLVFLMTEERCLSSNPRRVRALKESFVKGYGNIPVVATPVIAICEAMQRLVHLHGILISRAGYVRYHLENTPQVLEHVGWFTDAKRRRFLWPAA